MEYTEYIAEEVPDKVDILNKRLLQISNGGGKLITVIWREADNLYVIIFEVKRAEPSDEAGRDEAGR